MIKKIAKGLFAIIGAVAGYGIFALLKLLVTNNGNNVGEALTQGQQIGVGIFFAIIFGIIFYRLVPMISRQSTKMAENIGNDLQAISANDLLVGTIGLITGLVIALLISQIYANVINRYIYMSLTIVTYVVLGYVGVVVATKKGK